MESSYSEQDLKTHWTDPEIELLIPFKEFNLNNSQEPAKCKSNLRTENFRLSLYV